MWGESELVPGADVPLRPSTSDENPPSITSSPAQSNDCDAHDKGSKIASESTREAIRTDIAAGRLTIPKCFSKDSESTTVEGFTEGDNPLTTYQRLRYRLPFGPAISPPNPDLAFKVQILEYTRQWVLLAASISDDKRRTEVLDRAFDKYEKVWFEALRIGYASGLDGWSESGAKREHCHRVGTKKVRATKQRKKDPLPHAVPIFVPEKFKNGFGRPFPVTPITVGELEEAGVTESQVRKRADNGEYAQAEEIFGDLYNDLGRKVDEKDWDHAVAPTQMNPTGRDLFFYSLYLVQLYEWNLRILSGYQARFRTPTQIRNGMRNIEHAEQDRKLFLALALELNEQESTSASSKPGSEEDVDMQDTVIADDTIEKLLEAIDMVLESQDFDNIGQAFEASGYPENNLAIACHVGLEPSAVEVGKKALTEMLSYARYRDSAVREVENSDNGDDKTQWIEQVGVYDIKIREIKNRLKEVVPLLLALVASKDQAGVGNERADQVVSEVETNAESEIEMQSEITKSPASQAGTKRCADKDDGQSTPESPLKRQKVGGNGAQEHTNLESITEQDKWTTEEIENTDTSLPAVVAGQPVGQIPTINSDLVLVHHKGTTQRDDPQTCLEQEERQNMNPKEAYIQEYLFPLANNLLTANGHPPLDSNVTDFPGAKEALIRAGLSVIERNKLVDEYNRGLFNDWDRMQEDGNVHRQEESTGMDHLPLAGRSSDPNPLDERGIEAEDRSVAPSKPLTRFSLIVKLGMPPTSDYDPAQFSCNSIFNHKGFRYRYTRDSTLADRKSADEALDSYVRSRMERTRANLTFPRYGKYETICLPADPERKTVIHGIWDTRDGKPIDGAEWFYNENRNHPADAADDLAEGEEISSQAESNQRMRSFFFPKSLEKTTKKVMFAPILKNKKQKQKISNQPEAATNAPQKKTKVSPKILLRMNTGQAKHGGGRGNSSRGRGSRRGQVGRPKRANTMNKYVGDDDEYGFGGASSEEYLPGQSD